jgi:hypothetical protein
MILKAVTLFLVFIAVLGMFGKLHWVLGKRGRVAKCKTCGRFLIGKGTCDCGGA